MPASTTSQKPLSNFELLLFSAPALPMFGLIMPITVYVPNFYAEHLGLGLALVGSMMTLSRLWDVVSDPLMGVVSDRFPSRYGRRRHWLVLSIPLLILATWMLFMPSGPVTGLYLLGWLLVLYTGWTFATVSLYAWAAELSTDYDQRTRIMGWLQAMNVVGSSTVLVLPVIIQNVMQPSEDALRPLQMASMGWFVIGLLPIAILISVWNTPEHPTMQRANAEKLSWRQAIEIILRNQPLRRLIVADLCLGLIIGVIASLALFFTRYVMLLPALESISMLIYFIAGLLSIPGWMYLSRRFDKHRAMSIASIFSAIIFAGALFVPAGNATLLILLFVLLGIGGGAGQLLPRAIMADVVDVDSAASGEQRTGLYFALLTTTLKLGVAFGPGIAFGILAWYGFQPGGENNLAAIEGLRYVLASLPIILNIVVAVLMWNFPLDRAAQQTLRADLEAKVVGV